MLFSQDLRCSSGHYSIEELVRKKSFYVNENTQLTKAINSARHQSNLLAEQHQRQMRDMEALLVASKKQCEKDMASRDAEIALLRKQGTEDMQAWDAELQGCAQLLEDMQAQNKNLHNQLADLKAGERRHRFEAFKIDGSPKFEMMGRKETGTPKKCDVMNIGTLKTSKAPIATTKSTSDLPAPEGKKSSNCRIISAYTAAAVTRKAGLPSLPFSRTPHTKAAKEKHPKVNSEKLASLTKIYGDMRDAVPASSIKMINATKPVKLPPLTHGNMPCPPAASIKSQRLQRSARHRKLVRQDTN